MEVSFGSMPYHKSPTFAPDFSHQKKLRAFNRRNVMDCECRECGKRTNWIVMDAGIVHCGKCSARYVTHSDAELYDAPKFWQDLYGGAA